MTKNFNLYLKETSETARLFLHHKHHFENHDKDINDLPKTQATDEQRARRHHELLQLRNHHEKEMNRHYEAMTPKEKSIHGPQFRPLTKESVGTVPGGGLGSVQMDESGDYKIGDRVHMGLAVKGGAGHVGTVHKIEDDMVHIKLHGYGRFGDRVVKGHKRLVSAMSEEYDNNVSHYLHAHSVFRKHEHEVGQGKESSRDAKEQARRKTSDIWEKLSPNERKQVPEHMHWTKPRTYEESLDAAKLEEEYKVGDTVVPKVGPHKGHPHEVIHVHGDGRVNIRPKNIHPKYVRYRLGAASADPKDLESTMKESIIRNNPIVAEAFKAAIEKKKKPADKPEKLEVKGPGANDTFQADPVVTPLTSTFTRTP